MRRDHGGAILQVLVPISLILGAFGLNLIRESDIDRSLENVQSRVDSREKAGTEIATVLETLHGCTINLGTNPLIPPTSPLSATNKNITLSSSSSPQTLGQPLVISSLGIDGLPDSGRWKLDYTPANVNDPASGRVRADVKSWELSGIQFTVSSTPGHFGSPTPATGNFSPPVGPPNNNLSLAHGEMVVQLTSGVVLGFPMNFWLKPDGAGNRLLVGCKGGREISIATGTGNPFEEADLNCTALGGRVNTDVTEATNSPLTPRCSLDPLHAKALDPSQLVSQNSVDKKFVEKYREMVFSQWQTTGASAGPKVCANSDQAAQRFDDVVNSADPAPVCQPIQTGPNMTGCPNSCKFVLGSCSINVGPGQSYPGARYRFVQKTVNASGTSWYGSGNAPFTMACQTMPGTITSFTQCVYMGQAQSYPPPPFPGPGLPVSACVKSGSYATQLSALQNCPSWCAI